MRMLRASLILFGLLAIASCKDGKSEDPKEPQPTADYCASLPLAVQCGKCGAAATSRTTLDSDEYKCTESGGEAQTKCSAAAAELGCTGTCNPLGCLVTCPPRISCPGIVDGSPMCEDCGSGIGGTVYIDVDPNPSCGSRCKNLKDSRKCESGSCVDSNTCALKKCKK